MVLPRDGSQANNAPAIGLMGAPVNVTELANQVRRKIGRTGAAFVKTIEKGALLKFCRATGETNPLYVNEAYALTTPYAGLIAPPTYVSVFTTDAFAGVFERDLPLPRFLHTDDVIEYHAPMRVGDIITAQATLTDVFVKEGRGGPLLFQAAEMALTNQHDREVALVRVMMANFA